MNKFNNKIIVAIIVMSFIAITPEIILAKGYGDGSGGGMGSGRSQNMVDENHNGVPDGLDDEDGDGIVNRDEDDYEKLMINMRDEDGDGISNRDDEDYERPMDGLSRPEITDQKVGQGNSNRPEGVGNGEMMQNTSQTQQERQNRVTNGTGNGNGNLQMREQVEAKIQSQQIIGDDMVQLQERSSMGKIFDWMKSLFN